MREGSERNGWDARLRPCERLKKRPEFQAVLREGHKATGRFMTVVVRRTEGRCARLGIIASKKLGGAVVRNRAKRLVREVFRHVKHEMPSLQGCDVVVIPRPELVTAPITSLMDDFRAILSRRDERRRARERRREE